MPLPTIIQGPAVVVLDGAHIYSEGDIQLKFQRQTFNPKSQIGSLGPRLQSQKIVINFTPVGQLDATYIGKLLPYGRAAETVSGGASAMPGFPVCTKTTVIHSIISGVTYTFTKSGITKMPQANFAATKPVWGDVEITCIGDVSKALTDTDQIAALGGSPSWGTGIDETKMVTQPYSLAVGALSSPFDAIGANEGFILDPKMTVKEITDESVGLASIVLESVDPELTFAPNNLTFAQIEELVRVGTAGGGDENLNIGQPIGRGIGTAGSYAGQDFVLTATDIGGRTITVTLYKGGASDYDGTFGVGTHQHRKLSVMSNRRFTSGVAQKLFDIAIA